jgi:hypothetical protein
VFARNLSYRSAQTHEIVASLLHVAANPGADLDLRTQQLGCDLLAANFLALLHEAFGWVDD